MIVRGYIKGEPVDIELSEIGGGHWLRKDAAVAFVQMSEAAQQDGITLIVNQSFRTYDDQAAKREKYEETHARWVATGKKSQPPKYASRPGWSNHQGGVAVDINRAQGDNLATQKPDSPTDLWLEANAYKFGFYRTVKSEPWHFEFMPEVGRRVSV